MHDLLEVSPQIIFQQLTLKPTLKLKICELVTSNSILSPSLIKSISKLCNKVEITFVCSTDFEYELLNDQQESTVKDFINHQVNEIKNNDLWEALK